MGDVNAGGSAWTVDLQPLPDRAVLEPMWRRLEAEANRSFFQSWAWIGAWLTVLPTEPAPKLLRVSAGAEVVGLGIVCNRATRRHGFVVSRGLYVSETGDPAIDGLTVEHNGFLTKRGCETDVVARAVEFLCARVPRWDELYLSGIVDANVVRYRETAIAHGLRPVPRDEKAYRYVDLEGLRRAGTEYLAALSSNTRYQIRRALREYEKAGPLSLAAASTLEEARRYLADLIELHQAYWKDKGQPGAFASGLREDFHRTLVETGFPRGAVQLLAVRAGADAVGYLYNFVTEGRVYSYQSGFRYDTDNKLKPGLVSHYLAIDYNARAGAAVYDFLAGDSQYKRSLATHRGEMVWLTLQRGRLRFGAERALKALYRRWRAAPPQEGAPSEE